MPVGQKLEIKYQGRWLNISYYYEERGRRLFSSFMDWAAVKTHLGAFGKRKGTITTPYLPLIYPALVTLQNLPVFPMI